MANGLKGKFISYTNPEETTVTVTISGAVRFRLSASVGYNVWTPSMAAAGNINGQNSHKQAMPADFVLTDESSSKQANADFFEDIILELPTTGVLRGWIFGQSASWAVA